MMSAITSVIAEAPKSTDWMSGWSAVISTALAVGALIAAIVAAVATVRTNKMQSEQLRQLGEDRQTELAGKFGVWLDLAFNDQAVVMYHNSGHLPAFDVNIYFRAPSKQAKFRIGLGNVSPTQSPSKQLRASNELSEFLTVILDREFDEPITKTDPTTGLPHFSPTAHQLFSELLRETEITMVFTDANGKTWQRKPKGGLMLTGSAED